MVKSPLPSTLSAFLLSGKSQTLPPVVLVNHLALVNLFVMYKALQSKKDRYYACYVYLYQTPLFSRGEDWPFHREDLCLVSQ